MSQEDLSASHSVPVHKILIVDDHPIVRHGIKQIINQESDLKICAEAETSEQALKAMQEYKPDLALLDVSLKESNGFGLVKQIKNQHAIPVLMLSIHDELFYAERALRAGANGYIMKEAATEKLLAAIRCVLKGEIYLSEKMNHQMRSIHSNSSDGKVNTVLSVLTDREFEVFQLIGQGQSTRKIAERLHLSIKTIESHRAHIKEKLKLDGAVELMHYAVQWVHNSHFS